MSSHIPAQAPIDPTGRSVVDIEVYFEGGMDTVSIHANGRNQASVVVKYRIRDAAGKPLPTDGIHCELILADTGEPLQTAGWIVDERPSPYIAVYPCLPQEKESGQVRWIAPAPPVGLEDSSDQENETYTYKRFYVSRPEMGAPVTRVSAMIVHNGSRHAAGDASPGRSLVLLGCLPSEAYSTADLNVKKIMVSHDGQLTDDWNLTYDAVNAPANYWRRVDYVFTLADGHSIVTMPDDQAPRDSPTTFGHRVRGYYKTEPYLWPLLKAGQPFEPRVFLWAGTDGGVAYDNYLLQEPLEQTVGFVISFITTVTFSEPCSVDNPVGKGMITFAAQNGNQGTVYLDYAIPYYAAQTVPFTDEPGASAAAAYKGVLDSPNPTTHSTQNAHIKNSYGYIFDYVGNGSLTRGVFTTSKLLDRPEFNWAVAYSEDSFPWKAVEIWCAHPDAGNIGRSGSDGSPWASSDGEQLYAYVGSTGNDEFPNCSLKQWIGNQWPGSFYQWGKNSGTRRLHPDSKDDTYSSVDATMQTYPLWNGNPTDAGSMNCFLFKLLDSTGGQLRVISAKFDGYHRVVSADGWARTDNQSIVKFLMESLDSTWP